MPRTKKLQDETLLKMILEVIVEEGAASFSLEDLSKKTGLSPATLLQRFGSKQNILHKAVELANQGLKDSLKNRSLVHESAVQEIINIYLEFSKPFSNRVDVANGFDILKLDITEESLNKVTRNYFEIRRNKIESLVVLAQEKGEIATHHNANDLAWNLECLWQGSITLWALVGKGKLQQWLKKRLAVYLSQVQVKKS